MMKKVFFGCLVILLPALQLTAQPSALEIMQKSREVSRFPGLESVSELHILNNRGSERIRKIAMISRSDDGVEKRLIRFLAPADVKGTGLLIYDYDNKPDAMWIYLPALRKVRRIVSSEKGKSFMGSEFSNADMAAPNLPDFHLKLLGSDMADQVPCWVVEMVPVSETLEKEYGFARKKVYVGKEDYVLRKAVYIGREGQKEKQLTAGEVLPVEGSGQKMAHYLSMENLSNGRSSWLRMTQVQASSNVNPQYFTTDYLSRQ